MPPRPPRRSLRPAEQPFPLRVRRHVQGAKDATTTEEIAVARSSLPGRDSGSAAAVAATQREGTHSPWCQNLAEWVLRVSEWWELRAARSRADREKEA